MTDTTCQQCGSEDWGRDGRFSNLVCGSCGWMPPASRRETIRSTLAP